MLKRAVLVVTTRQNIPVGEHALEVDRHGHPAIALFESGGLDHVKDLIHGGRHHVRHDVRRLQLPLNCSQMRADVTKMRYELFWRRKLRPLETPSGITERDVAGGSVDKQNPGHIARDNIGVPVKHVEKHVLHQMLVYFLGIVRTIINVIGQRGNKVVKG